MWTLIALTGLGTSVWLYLLAIDAALADRKRFGKRWRLCTSLDVIVPSVGILCMILTALYALVALWLPIVWMCWL